MQRSSRPAGNSIGRSYHQEEKRSSFSERNLITYDEFNGPDHDEDPREKGYISIDGFHASTEGVYFQAEILHALGYDAIVP